MKKIYLYYFLAFGVCFASCKKFLDTKPQNNLFPQGYYVTKEELTYGINSVYDALFSVNIYGNNALYMLGWMADEGYMNRSTIATGPFRNIVNSADSYARLMWQHLYISVNRANVVLANVDNNTEISQEFRDNIRGEALFMRGYFYFMLVQNFGGVPIKLQPSNSVVDVNIARASVQEVYDQILKDMKEAEPLVRDIKQLGYGGKISKSAVRGILARVCLNMAGFPLNDGTKFQEAASWAKKVIDDQAAGHSLNPSYSNIFIKLAADQYDIQESIWELEYWGNNLDGYNEAGTVGYINGISTNLNSPTGRSDAYMSITSKLFNSYNDGDLRKYWNIPFFNYLATGPNGAKTLISKDITEERLKYRNPGKYRREFETYLPKAGQRTPINLPMLRFADVLLMYAEAINEVSGPTTEAVNAVNLVRRRAWSKGIKNITVTSGGSGYTSAPTVSISGNGGAAARAIVTNGQVTAIELQRDTTGITYELAGNYSTTPTITISGGEGSGATAVASIYTAADAEITAADKASKESFRRLIQDERMRELNFEHMRKFDLIRWGIYYETMHDMAAQILVDNHTAVFSTYYSNVQTPRDLLMPIPIDELKVNSAMTQNPGY